MTASVWPSPHSPSSQVCSCFLFHHWIVEQEPQFCGHVFPCSLFTSHLSNQDFSVEFFKWKLTEGTHYSLEATRSPCFNTMKFVWKREVDLKNSRHVKWWEDPVSIQIRSRPSGGWRIPHHYGSVVKDDTPPFLPEQVGTEFLSLHQKIHLLVPH